jgi:conjugative transfer region protein TrbK
MNLSPIAFVAAALALCACSKAPAQADPKAMTGQQLSQETDRCRGLGLKAYDDPSCNQAEKESNDRFYGGSPRRSP